MAEVESQLNSTRAQASKAAKFRETSFELQLWWQGLAADDFRFATAERTRLNGSLQERLAEYESLASEQAELETRLAALDADVATADEELRDVEQSASAVRERIAGHEATVHFQTTRLEELDAELVRLRRQVFRTVGAGCRSSR